jgi:Cft2 family RNA processing exonuclease
MSRVITNTNIIVDDFDFCKSFPKGTFVHFLTHFHSDHYEGLSPLWDYGPIYCSHMTKKFILDKYPKIKNVYSFDFYDRQTI